MDIPSHMIRSGTDTQLLSDDIDQLDLALDQLAVSDRNFDRFAMMLVDNVVELTLHRFAELKAQENKFWSLTGTPKNDPEAVQAALGQHFDVKARFAAKFGLISTEVRDSLLYLHGFRNTTYHRGLRHDGILHSLAVFYFRVACEVRAAFKPFGWSTSGADRLSYRALKYLGGRKPGFHYSEAAKPAFERLAQVAASLKESLVADLSTDMRFTIDLTDDSIQFLSDNAPGHLTRDQVVVDAQAWRLAFSGEGAAAAEAQGYSGSSRGDLLEWLTKKHRWNIGTDPIPGWRSRVTNLERETDHHKAIARYCQFMDQTEQFRAAIRESASALDREIQSQIDRARGK